MSVLAVKITFPAGCYHGSNDWPPAPMRLFQALVAGVAEHYRGHALPQPCVDAFRWLEQLNPPKILAERDPASSFHRLFVPNNNADTVSKPDALKTKKDVQRRYAKSVTYFWEIGEDKKEALNIVEVAKHLYRLGRGVDAAWAQVVIIPEIPTVPSGLQLYTPGSKTGSPLRVPVSGSFDSLERRWQSWLVRNKTQLYLSPESDWEEVYYRSTPEQPSRHYQMYRFLGTDYGRFAWPQWNVVTLAAMVRHSVLERLQTSPGLYKYAAGHANAPHPAWLPLPSVGHKQADGYIRRALIAGEPNGNEELFQQLVFPLRHGIDLLQHGHKTGVMSEMEKADGVIRLYLRASEEWVTVTPVVLPGYDKHGRKIESLMIKALRHVGYSTEVLKGIEFQRAPFLPMSLWPGKYRVPKHLPYTRIHVRLRFLEPVSGPIVLGAGGYYGLGLMVSI